jgi:hypothetical protein
MSGVLVGVSGGTGLGCPGCDGWGVSGRGSSGTGGGCCMDWFSFFKRTFVPPRELPVHSGLPKLLSLL